MRYASSRWLRASQLAALAPSALERKADQQLKTPDLRVPARSESNSEPTEERSFRRVVRSARFTTDEWQRVRTRAAEVGLSPGRFLRQAALGSRLGGRVTDRAVAELGKIGSNLNQLARATNTAREFVARHEIEAVLARLRAVLLELGRRG